jgi:CO/xanthine dehydrogenase Mo-binding subunit
MRLRRVRAGFKANAWVAIQPDGSIVLTCHRTEMGQDVHTSLAMLLAEELEVDPRSVKIVQAGATRCTSTSCWAASSPAASTSIRDAWDTLRQAGAAARMMLAGAAAAKWNVPAGDVRAENGYLSRRLQSRLVWRAGGRRREAAGAKESRAQVARQVEGHRQGAAAPGRLGQGARQDRVRHRLRAAGMVYAALAQCPVIGGKVASFVQTPVKRAGVHKVVNIGEGVAVIADHYWIARTRAGRREDHVG